jgi:hypothetical protein
MVAVTFEVVSLRTTTLSESVFPLLKTFLELLFWIAFQDGRCCLKICGPSKRSSVLGIAKSHMGPNLANMLDGPISILIFLAKNSQTASSHEQEHCYDARSKHQAKVQVFSNEQPHVTLPIFPKNNASSLFDLVQEIQSEQCPCDKKKTNEHCLHLGS